MAGKSTAAPAGRPALWFGALSAASGSAHADHALVSGHGCFVRDVSGREYLDARSALWNASLGYSNGRIIAAIVRQLGALPVAQLIRHDQPAQVALTYADRLVTALPEYLRHVRFCSTGAQAVEGAVLLSRFIRIQDGQPDRTQVLALWDGYHGIGGLAASLTGERPLHEVLAPLSPGVHHVAPMDAGALRAAIDRIGPRRLTAVIMEPVLGTDVVELPPGYLRQVQGLCQAQDIHFILDEITTGFGRTGSMTVAGRLGLSPDMLLLSKGITAGYAPLSAIVVTEDILERALAGSAGVFPHGSTADGHPVAIAAARALLDELADGSVLANVTARAAQLTSQVGAMAGRQLDTGGVRGIHGCGLMIAVELADRRGQPLSAQVMHEVKQCCRDEGLLVSICNSLVVLTPPLVITSGEVELLVDLLGRGLARALGRPLTSLAGGGHAAQSPTLARSRADVTRR
jgi:adenosylmethionine-8-amino-7-oxononanoate aminotransferase